MENISGLERKRFNQDSERINVVKPLRDDARDVRRVSFVGRFWGMKPGKAVILNAVACSLIATVVCQLASMLKMRPMILTSVARIQAWSRRLSNGLKV